MGFQTHYLPETTTVLQWVGALAFLFVAVFYNATAQVILDDLGTTLFANNTHVLPDLGFALLPHMEYHEVVNLTSPILTIVFALALWATTGRFFSAPLRHVVIMQAIIFFLRATFLGFTILPAPLPSCKEVPEWVLSWNIATRPWLVLTGQYQTCFDTFFSGHASNLTLITLAWFHWVCLSHGLTCCNTGPVDGHPTHPHHLSADHSHRHAHCPPSFLQRVGRILVAIFYVTALLMIIMSRFHYTLDVVAGVCVSALIFFAYLYYYESHPPVASHVDDTEHIMVPPLFSRAPTIHLHHLHPGAKPALPTFAWSGTNTTHHE